MQIVPSHTSAPDGVFMREDVSASPIASPNWRADALFVNVRTGELQNLGDRRFFCLLVLLISKLVMRYGYSLHVQLIFFLTSCVLGILETFIYPVLMVEKTH